MSLEPYTIFAGIAVLIALSIFVTVIFIKRSSDNSKPVSRSSAQPNHEPETESKQEEFLRLARAAYARGDYQQSIENYEQFAKLDPDNRLPWVEIANIQRDHLRDPKLAIRTLKNALEGQDWTVNDAAFFMIRLAELNWQDFGDATTSRGILNQVIELFPDTRHSANATHLLHEIKAAA